MKKSAENGDEGAVGISYFQRVLAHGTEGPGKIGIFLTVEYGFWI